MSNLLSPEAKKKAVILPWTHEPDHTLSLDQLNSLQSDGGTDPTVQNSDSNYKNFLSRTSLWVLLTDGEIDAKNVSDFAVGIGNAGLHGTAAIVILFGILRKYPHQCNISVGTSVFAVAADCLFLFYNAKVGTIYIMQCKGCFRGLFPSKSSEIVLDRSTQWKELPTVTYQELRSLRIPGRRQLDGDSIVLTSGRTLDLNRVYQDTLEEELIEEIFDVDDNLKSLLLTATSKGRKEDVRRWIAKRRKTVKNVV